MVVESMLSVYKQAEGIRPADQADFAFYALITLSAIRHHHHTEEENYLPLLEPEFKAPIQEEHHLFTDVLHKLEGYLQEVTGIYPDAFKGPIPIKNAKHPLLSDPMLTHLEHEIGYLDAAKLRECGLPLSKLEAWETWELSMIKNLNPWVSLVFTVAHTPSNSYFPPLPPGMRSVLVPWIFWWKYRKSWRFCPQQEPLDIPKSRFTLPFM
ncbi:hypothetical protein M408DRAFT_26214 [Serendipita vermifera MAFF 305830]|uniref:Hemerythrin-like domain-containing protein n=1 Tax=Serendipita vermifera MAFF 305830 TaxID=933852 RepID=A0A0C3AZM6_SERVB|nr:hypothetical protein M408DRAFT_26214 [Serendipita vermifera MAFF 305830]